MMFLWLGIGYYLGKSHFKTGIYKENFILR